MKSLNKTRLSGVGQRIQTVSEDGTVMNSSITNPLDCTNLTVRAISENNDLRQNANDLIQSLGADVASNVQVIAVTRLRSRFNNRPDLLKISFWNREEKILVLWNKTKLKDNEELKKVFIKSSKSSGTTHWKDYAIHIENPTASWFTTHWRQRYN